MRRRELIARLKDDDRELRISRGGLFGGPLSIQAKEVRRQIIFHGLETLLPEIIEKLEQGA